MSKKPNLHFIALIATYILTAPTFARAQDEQARDTSGRQSNWINEVEPGIRVIGNVDPIVAVGQGHAFVTGDANWLIIGSLKNELLIWDLEQQAIRDRIDLGRLHSVWGMSFTPDRKQLVVTSSYGHYKLLFLDADTFEIDREIDLRPSEDTGDFDSLKQYESRFINEVVFSPDGNRFAYHDSQNFCVHKVSDGELVYRSKKQNDFASVAFSHDGSQLYVYGTGIKTLDIESGEVASGSPFGKASLYSHLQKHPTRNLWACASSNYFALFDLDKNIQLDLEKFRGSRSQFSRDGSKLAVYCLTDDASKASMRVLDGDSGKLIKKFDKVNPNVHLFEFSRDGRKIFMMARGAPGVAELDLDRSEEVAASRKPFSGLAMDICISPDSSKFASVATDGAVRILDIRNGDIEHSAPVGNSNLIRYSHDGDRVLMARKNMVPAYVLEMQTDSGETRRRFRIGSSIIGHSVSIVEEFRKRMIPADRYEPLRQSYSLSLPGDVRYSRDGNEILVALGVDKKGFKFQCYDQQSGKLTSNFDFDTFTNRGFSQAQAISPGGKRVAVAVGNCVKVFATETGELLFELPIGYAQRLAFSRDSKFLAASSEEKTEVWQLDTEESVLELPSFCPTVSFSSKSNRLLLAPLSCDEPVQVFDTETWEPIVERTIQSVDRICGAISPNGRKLVFGLADMRYEIWDSAELENAK